MKGKFRIWFYPKLFMGIILVFTSNCKKDEKLSKKIPIITWANPADIYYGQLLDTTQLNATANIPGAFVYNPVKGTKLDSGANQILKVSFTPTDVIANDTISKIVKINVVLPPLKITDIDSNSYSVVLIGTQLWITDNLKTTKYNDGTEIPLVTDNTAWGALTTPAYCWPYNNTVSKTKGALYNWYVLDAASNGGKNICPIGWHVPSKEDWVTLITYLGDEYYANIKLKEAGTSHWDSPNPGTNETGFTALPGVFRGESGLFGGFFDGEWASSTACDAKSVYALRINGPYNGHWMSNKLFIAQPPKVFGLSVRCVKD